MFSDYQHLLINYFKGTISNRNSRCYGNNCSFISMTNRSGEMIHFFAAQFGDIHVKQTEVGRATLKINVDEAFDSGNVDKL
jgi:hypothetical protein